MRTRSVATDEQPANGKADVRLASSPSVQPGSEAQCRKLSLDLVELERERTEAVETISRLTERRKALLLEDAPASAFEKIESELKRLGRFIERADLLEPNLRQQLEVAQLRFRHEQWLVLLNQHSRAATAALEAIRTAAEARDAVLLVAHDCNAFDHRLALQLSIPPIVISPENIARFAAALEHETSLGEAPQQMTRRADGGDE